MGYYFGQGSRFGTLRLETAASLRQAGGGGRQDVVWAATSRASDGTGVHNTAGCCSITSLSLNLSLESIVSGWWVRGDKLCAISRGRPDQVSCRGS